jgi:hypothetical protein
MTESADYMQEGFCYPYVFPNNDMTLVFPVVI